MTMNGANRPALSEIAEATRSLRRMTGLFALAMVGCIVAGQALSPTHVAINEALKSTWKLRIYLTEHRTAWLISAMLGAVAWNGIFPAFLSGLSGLLTRENGSPRFALGVGYACGILGSIAFLIHHLGALSCGYMPAHKNGDVLIATFHAMFLSGNVGSLAMAFSLAGFGWVLMRRPGRPSWIGEFGLLVAALQVFAACALAQNGAYSPMGLPRELAFWSTTLWVFLAGIILLRYESEIEIPSVPDLGRRDESSAPKRPDYHVSNAESHSNFRIQERHASKSGELAEATTKPPDLEDRKSPESKPNVSGGVGMGGQIPQTTPIKHATPVKLAKSGKRKRKRAK